MPHPRQIRTSTQRYYRGAVTSMSSEPWMRSLGCRVHVTAGGCWQVGDDPDLYTSVVVRGQHTSGHRAVYAVMNPDDDIHGMHIHHMCETPACINPAHLVAMTPAEHLRLHRAA